MASIFAGNQAILTPKASGLEPVRKALFQVTLQDGNGGSSDGDLNFLVKSFSPPEKSVEVKSVRFVNHDKSYPGQRSAGGGTALSLRCMVREQNSPTHQFLQKWFDSIYDSKTDTVALIGENYPGQVVLTPLNVDASVFATCTLKGAWPSSIKLDDADADDDGNPFLFTTIFQCQDIIYTF